MSLLATWLHKMGDHASGWKQDGDSWSYLRRVQFRSMEDLRAIAEVLTEYGGVARFTFGGYQPKTLDEIENTANADLEQIWIAAFAQDPGPETVPLSGSFAWVRIVNAALKDRSPGTPCLSIYVSSTQDKVSASGVIRMLTVSKLGERVLRATERVGRFHDRHYPVIDTITKPTLQQREHDRKVRRQAGWISAAVGLVMSVITTLVTTGVVTILFPQATGK